MRFLGFLNRPNTRIEPMIRLMRVERPARQPHLHDKDEKSVSANIQDIHDDADIQGHPAVAHRSKEGCSTVVRGEKRQGEKNIHKIGRAVIEQPGFDLPEDRTDDSTSDGHAQ